MGGPQTKVRVRTRPPDPRDRLALRQTEPVGIVVPRFGLRRPVGGRPGTPTPWTSPFARRPAAGATASLRSVRRATAVTPTARHTAGPRPAGARCSVPKPAISAVRKDASITATISVPTAPGRA